ncbi:MAG: hypothetical protein DMG86_01330 [Acidobacteria bacterium]|nr:MAG: hypothetical protein DMG86_01330 [Acidobacteriota bacterium]
MEHSCYQCGAAVDEGIAFCPQCNAPQIRVAVGDAITSPTIDSGLEIKPSGSYTNTSQITALQWSYALPAAALAGLIAAVMMLIPGGAFGLGMLASGALAVLFYRRRNPVANVTPGIGARLGALSGALGFGIFAIFTAAGMLIFRSGGQLRDALLQAIQQSAARSSDPQAQQMLEYLKSPQGLALMMALGLIVMGVAFLIFSSLGGALAAALLRRKDRH